MKVMEYRKIPTSVNEISVSIPLELVERFEKYHELEHYKLNKRSNELNVKYKPEFYKVFDEIGSIREFIKEEKSIKLKGKKSIDRLLEIITHNRNIVNDCSLFEEIYRVVVEQLLTNGWPIICMVYKFEKHPYGKKDHPYGNFFILGPFVPCYNRDFDIDESLVAYIQKEGKISKMMNETELVYFHHPNMIFIEEEDAEFLKLIPNERVLVWFFHGNI